MKENAIDFSLARASSATGALVHQLIRSRRSVRRFKQKPIPLDIIKEIVEDARFAPSGGNRQPWEFIVVNQKELLPRVFNNIYFLLQRGRPKPKEAPVCYLIVLGNPSLSSNYKIDCAFATQNILLSAWAEGLGSCVLGSVRRKKLKKIFGIPESLEVVFVVALGYPAEEPVTEDGKGKAIRPWVDKQKQLHVPKRKIETILHFNGY